MKLNDSKLLLSDANDLLKTIENLYNKSLTDKSVPEILFVKIKHYIDNIRSSLDYAAFNIFESYSLSSISPEKIESAKRRVYFPICDTFEDFNKKIDATFPNLRTSKTEIVKILEGCQPYSNSWLKTIEKLSNDNKHRHLTPQTRTEYKEVKVTSPLGSLVSWDPSSVTFGSGASINGVPINPKTQMPAYDTSNKVEVITWVGFNFTDLNVPVIPTLKIIYNEALYVIEQLDKLI